MAFGDVLLSRGDEGSDVEELQLRLAGFRGTVWDGIFGPGTELQVQCFQRDVMELAAPSGAVDDATFYALFRFEREWSTSSATPTIGGSPSSIPRRRTAPTSASAFWARPSSRSGTKS